MLRELIDLCEGEVMLSVNSHKSSYESVEDHIERERLWADVHISDDVEHKMVELDTFVHLTVYPDTPIGFYSVYHYDVGIVIEEVVKMVKEGRNGEVGS